MAYEKQTWATGDTITAAKLNHMEDGINNASLISDTFYAVPGDYADGDVLEEEEVSKIFEIIGNGGIVIISTSSNYIFFGNMINGFFNFQGDQLTINSETGVITITPA